MNNKEEYWIYIPAHNALLYETINNEEPSYLSLNSIIPWDTRLVFLRVVRKDEIDHIINRSRNLELFPQTVVAVPKGTIDSSHGKLYMDFSKAIFIL